MISSDAVYWLKICLTFVLAILGITGLLSYFYLDIRGFYRIRENRWWVGFLATGLPLISLTLGILIWMIWNPLLHKAFWPLFFLSIIVSFLLGQSVTSPYKLADWWIEFSKWQQKRKSR
jgi:hypothetical protein